MFIYKAHRAENVEMNPHLDVDLQVAFYCEHVVSCL